MAGHMQTDKDVPHCTVTCKRLGKRRKGLPMTSRVRALAPPRNPDPGDGRHLDAADLAYYRSVITEAREAEQRFAQAQEELIEARGAVKSVHRHFIRTYGIDPEAEGVNLETGLIGPLTPTSDGSDPEPHEESVDPLPCTVPAVTCKGSTDRQP